MIESVLNGAEEEEVEEVETVEGGGGGRGGVDCFWKAIIRQPR